MIIKFRSKVLARRCKPGVNAGTFNKRHGASGGRHGREWAHI